MKRNLINAEPLNRNFRLNLDLWQAITYFAAHLRCDSMYKEVSMQQVIQTLGEYIKEQYDAKLDDSEFL